MRRTNDHSLKDAIKHLLNAYKLKGKILETRLLGEWETLVGDTVAKYTDDLYVRDKKLYIKVSNATVRQELLYSKDELLKQLNAFAGENALEDIIVR
jgi:predicted nucleic acid-binding Zn ribbon protein